MSYDLDICRYIAITTVHRFDNYYKSSLIIIDPIHSWFIVKLKS